MNSRRRLWLVGLVGLWVLWMHQEPAVAAVRSGHVCSELCVEGGTSCDQECWLTQADFDNGAPSTTCAAEGYECCGDGFCNPGTEACNVCTDDCGTVSSCGTTCNSNADCDPGDVCNAAHECVPYTGTQDGEHTPICGGSCTSNSDCCGSDVCLGSSGQKYCGIPESTYCPNAPACSGTINGIAYTNCNFSGFCIPDYVAADAYCDPGTNRCEFNQSGYGCVDVDTNICVVPPAPLYKP